MDVPREREFLRRQQQRARRRGLLLRDLTPEQRLRRTRQQALEFQPRSPLEARAQRNMTRRLEAAYNRAVPSLAFAEAKMKFVPAVMPSVQKQQVIDEMHADILRMIRSGQTGTDLQVARNHFGRLQAELRSPTTQTAPSTILRQWRRLVRPSQEFAGVMIQTEQGGQVFEDPVMDVDMGIVSDAPGIAGAGMIDVERTSTGIRLARQAGATPQ